MSWKIEQAKTVFKGHVFELEELTLTKSGDNLDKHSWHRFRCQDWVNILPITADRQALLIGQHRVGSFSTILETPGGMLDPGEERDPMMAAVRELEEETGFTTQRVLPLGNFFANPALQTNRCHFFLGLNCAPNPNRQHFPDENEDITLKPVPVDDLQTMVRTGQIDHVFAALCIQLAQPYLNSTP